MIEMSLGQVLELFGESDCESLDQRFRGVTIDSRNGCSNCLFVAIRGDNFDGHDYVNSAYQNGLQQ